MLHVWVRTLLLAGLLGSPDRLCAQLDLERTERLSLEQGLSNQEIRDIHRDLRGFLWLATGLHLERFDGYGFQPYHVRVDSAQRLHGRDIAQIGESADAHLYVSYRGNLDFIDLFHTDRFDCRQVFLNDSTGLQGVVRSLYMEEQGDFLVLSSLPDALLIWRLNDRHRFEKLASLPWAAAASEQFRLLKSKTGDFWVHGSRHGLFRLDNRGFMLQKFDNQSFNLPKNRRGLAAPPPADDWEPAIFYEDGQGRFWLSFKNRPGVYLFPKGADSAARLGPWTGFSAQEYFTRLWEDGKGTLLFACPTPDDRYTFSRLLGLRANGEHFDAGALLKVEDKILDVFGQDFERQVFLGTYTGMYKIFLKNKGIQQYLTRSIRPGQFGDIVRSITGDGRDRIFFALEERYWYQLHMRTNRLDTLVLTDASGQPIALTCSGAALAYDPAGYLWGMGCTDEAHYNLHRYDLVRKTTRSWPLDGRLVTFHRRPDGRFCLLFRSDEKGGEIVIFDPRTEKYTAYRDADGVNPFAKRFPKYILASRFRPGLLWIGTNEGVVAVDMERRSSGLYGARSEVAALNFSHPTVLALYEDEAGTLWVGTGGGGLNILSFQKQISGSRLPQPAALKIVDKSQGLSNDQVCGLLPDGQGGCLLSTDLGLNYYHPANHIIGNFYRHDGLTDNEFDRYSFYKDENGRFYFGTINGLNAFYLPDLLGQKPAGHICLTKLTKYSGQAGRLEEQTVGLGTLEELVIEPEVSYFQLDFMLTDYTQPEKNRFSVWLEGQEKDWTSLGSTHTLRYNRLPAGEYVLHLRGTDAQGNWTKTPFTLRIRSEEFFYRSWWFLSLLVLAMLAGAGALAQWRIRTVRVKEQRRTALNARLAELETRALQAQMNPHFIFNCLNSIQSLIAEGDKENAMRYVSRFAQLTRAVLHFTGKTTIGLDDEIAALRHYLELECLRTGQRVQYQIEVAPDIVPFDVELPPMLVQPFVENSFKHGNISRLKVIFRKMDGHLVVTVQDDGAGPTGKTDKLHQSRGIAMTRERLAYWNGRTDPADLRIIPLEKGLLVTMTIQLK